MYKLRAKISAKALPSLDIPIVGMLIKDTIDPDNIEHWIIEEVNKTDEGWTVYAHSVERNQVELWCIGGDWKQFTNNGCFKLIGMTGINTPTKQI